MNDATQTTGVPHKPTDYYPDYGRLAAYLRERRPRLMSCPGGAVTKYPGRYSWYCDGCGEEFTNEAEAIGLKHLSITMIESCDTLSGDVQSIDTIDAFRRDNAEDGETLDALGRMMDGESREEHVGFVTLRVHGEVIP